MTEAHVVQKAIGVERLWSLAGFDLIVRSSDLVPEVVPEADYVHRLFYRAVIEPTTRAHDLHPSRLLEVEGVVQPHLSADLARTVILPHNERVSIRERAAVMLKGRGTCSGCGSVAHSSMIHWARDAPRPRPPVLMVCTSCHAMFTSRWGRLSPFKRDTESA